LPLWAPCRIGLSILTTGQPASKLRRQPASPHHVGVVDDWSFHHLVFSNPGTYEQVKNDPAAYSRWLSIQYDTRYIMQQMKRNPMQQALATAPDLTTLAGRLTAPVSDLSIFRPARRRSREENLKNDWSAGLEGTYETVTGTLSGNNASSTSTFSVGGQTFTGSPPTQATATGTFSGNPNNGQTVVIGGQTFTASYDTQATNGSITVAASGICIGTGQGITINGTTNLTTNATEGTGSFTMSNSVLPTPGEYLTIGGVTYYFETTLSPTGPANQVLVPSTTYSNTYRNDTAVNLAYAINGGGTCGYPSGGPCTQNLAGVNPQVSSTSNAAGTETLTSRCGDNAAIINGGSSHVVVTTIAAASSAGTNTTTTFALNTSGSSTTPPSQSLTAAGILYAINHNATTSAIVTATAGATGVVDLAANTWGTVGNYTVALYNGTGIAQTGVTVASLTNGANVSNTATTFAIDNNTTDAATNLVAAITANNNTGVTPSSSTNVVTLKATTAGTGGNSIAFTNNLNNFSLAATGNLSGGSDGTTSGSLFAYWSGAAAASTTQLAINIAQAIDDNTTLQESTGVTATPGASTVIVTARATGTATISTPTPTNFSDFTWNHTSLQGGVAATGTMQPNAYPAKYGASLTNASCADFVVYPTGIAGSTTNATIVAYNNLYTAGCAGAVPSVYWAYNTGAYAVSTSPIISQDGTMVAFIQSTSTVAQLVVLKFNPAGEGSLGSPVIPTTSSTGMSCSAPCMTVTALGSGINDIYSSPFYDFWDDALYVGGNSSTTSYLIKFAPVFKATASVTPLQATLTSGTNPVASPVFDAVSGCVFVGDTYGYLYRVNSGVPGTATSPPCASTTFGSSGTTATSENLGNSAAGDGIFDGPIVDSTTGMVYAFVTDSATITRTVTGSVTSGSPNFSVSVGTLSQADVGLAITGTGVGSSRTIATVNSAGTGGTLSANATGTYGPETLTITTKCAAGDNCVAQFSTGFGAGAAPNAAQPLRTGAATYNLYAGAFDNVYFASSTPAGDLWVVGNTGTAGGYLYRIPISKTDGSIGAPVAMISGFTDTDSGHYVFASPLTEFCSGPCTTDGTNTTGTGSVDHIFFSVDRLTSEEGTCGTSSTDGCVLSFTVTDPAATLTLASASSSALGVTTAGTPGCWSTGGLVIDNSDITTTGASNIYFLGLNGALAGGPVGKASSACTTTATATVNATQASQASP
jgi:hypothetical protein